MFVMACGDILFAGLVAFLKDCVNAIQAVVVIHRGRNGTRLEFHLSAIRQRDRFQWPEYTIFIDCVDCLHDSELAYPV